MFALITMPCGCHSGNKSTNDSKEQVTKDSDEYVVYDNIDAIQEIPCPEYKTIEEAEIQFAQSGLNHCFFEYIANNPSTIDYSFRTLKNSDNMPVNIVDAADGSIRIYGWDNQTGGTCISWSAIYQVCDKGKVYTYEGLPDWKHDQYLITAIYQLPHPKRHLYLFDGYFREWSSQSYIGFIAYERIGHELRRVKILQNEEGELVDEIGFEYCVPEYYFNFALALSWGNMYQWDKTKSILYFPLPREDKYTYLTDRFIRYRWNQSTLESTDTVCNPRLHESLRNYVCCFRHTKTEDIQVRIDSLADGRLRYTVWDSNQNISTKPHTVLYGKSVGDEYHFYDQKQTYVVSKEE